MIILGLLQGFGLWASAHNINVICTFPAFTCQVVILTNVYLTLRHFRHFCQTSAEICTVS